MSGQPFLIVGGDGEIGAALVAALRARGDTVIPTSRRANRSDDHIHLDLAMAPDSWHWPTDIQTAIICAAMTSIEACEQAPELSEAVNVTAPTALVERLSSDGVRCLVLSTSMVYDGRTSHPPVDHASSPMTIYGRQKAKLEKNISAMGEAHASLRLTKVLTADNPLLRRWVSDLGVGRATRAFDDMVFAPVGMVDAVGAILHVVETGQGGVFQYSARDDISYFAAARHIGHHLNADAALVQSSSWVDAGLDADRAPAHTAFDCAMITDSGGPPAPDAYDVLDQVVDEMTGRDGGEGA